LLYKPENNHSSLFIFLFLIILSFQTISAQDSLAVVELYKSTDGDNWVNNENWLSEKPINEWFGITAEDTSIVALELPLNHLKGELPKGITTLTNLKFLNLAQNDLSGPVSDVFSKLKALEDLNISQNDFTDEILKDISKLQNLKNIDISKNSFFGEIPKTIANLKNLETFDISDNSFIGELPRDLFKLQKLSKLTLHGNYFSGPLPRYIGNLIQLTYLDLSRNQFSGNVPKEIGKLVNLNERLALNHNQFNGDIPQEICSLYKLENLWLNNNQFKGILPFDIGKMTTIKSLFIYQNNLIGPLPKSIGNLRNLEIFYAQNNSFGGPIPNELWFLPKLKMLKLESNEFTGSIPGNLHILKSIQSIDLSYNRFDSIADTLALPNSMLSYNLSGNRLFCDITDEKDSLQMKLDSQSQGKIIGIYDQDCTEVIDNRWYIEPSYLDFENVSTDTSVTLNLSLFNSSDSTYQINLQNFNVDNFIVPDAIITIAPNDTTTISITYSPIDDELHNDVIIITNTSTEQTKFVTVTGQGYESDIPDRDNTIPWRFKLHPIAFTDSSDIIIKYDIPKSSNANITIYNLGGRPVKTLVDGQIEVGYHEMYWNYQSDENVEIEGGEYLVVMQAGMFIQIQPLLLIY